MAGAGSAFRPSAPLRGSARPCFPGLWLAALLVSVVVPPAAAEDSSLSAGPLPGAYQGQVYNGDNLDPVLTVFFRDGSARLRGTYAVGEDEGFQAGALEDCGWDADYLLRCRWTDRHGTGIVRMLFSADYRSFRGFWGTGNDDTFLPWDGYLSDEGEDSEEESP